nr:venom peptide [Acharia stimulea]
MNKVLSLILLFTIIATVYSNGQVECPLSELDGRQKFPCPTPDAKNRYRCIESHVLCDNTKDCPNGEDEDAQSCLFFKVIQQYLDIIAEAVLKSRPSS